MTCIVVQIESVDFHGRQTGLVRATQDLHGSENSFLWSSQHLNMCQQVSQTAVVVKTEFQDLLCTETGLYDLQRAFTTTTGLLQLPQNFHGRENGFIWPSQHLNRPLQLWKLNLRTFIAVKQACTFFTEPGRQQKRLYLIYPAVKVAGKSFGGG